ncbi:hypothetical protein WA026_005572 [Henosepilachna vigintioctopunctata]|uniref:Serpin domain-containing protein n=1 Tax=Henosepilachna vigintioctopunctata TaxID=420089 RepID=A0AAW1U282_9CUCU
MFNPRYEAFVKSFVNDFGQRVLKSTPGNVIVSPLSAQRVLALTQLGARGATAAELTKGLHLPDSKENVQIDFKELHSKLRTNQFYTLNFADKIYLKEGYSVKAEFMELAKEIFEATLETVNFADEVKATETINEWVRSQTNNRIRNLVKPGTASILTKMILVNAINFKAKWSLQFERLETCKRKFFKSEDETLHVDTMHQTGIFKYVENKKLDAKILQLPYKGRGISMTVALPNQKEGLETVENRFSEILFDQKYQPKGLSLFMPKFRIESSLVLNSVLQESGIKKAFDSDEADFSGLLANDERLVITDVVQKAFIRVTETGTEIPEGNGGGLRPYFISSEKPLEIRLDRPFFFAITLGNIPLYLGRVKEPTY